MYGSAALLHRGIYASVRIRAPAAAAAASPEVVTVLPGRCDRCPGGGGGGGGEDRERRTLPPPCRRRCCLNEGAASPLDARSPLHGLPADPARTRSLIVVARPGCPDCHSVGLVPNLAAAGGQKAEQLRNYGTVTTTAT